MKFYCFDIDGNILNLTTKMILFHEQTRQEKEVDPKDLKLQNKDYIVDMNGPMSSFRYFNDRKRPFWKRYRPQNEYFYQDILEILQSSRSSWQGPSWTNFVHAVKEGAPISLITARGHRPQTIKAGIDYLLNELKIAEKPLMDIYPVGHQNSMYQVTSHQNMTTSQLKGQAFGHFFQKAIQQYGDTFEHTFGMSDDLQENLQEIKKVMLFCKRDFPHMKFFLYWAHNNQLIKEEVLIS